jgi:hypothetical protein
VPHSVTGFDDGDAANSQRITGQVEARAKADFENVAADVLQQFLALFGHGRSAQGDIAKPRKDDPRIEAHRTFPSVSRDSNESSYARFGGKRVLTGSKKEPRMK